MFTPSLSGFGRVLLAFAVSTLPAFAGSQARIVRLSDVHGSVQIDKNTGIGFESAFLNLPITQGTQLKTADNGRAEIEFEDGSAVRLAPNTSVDFSTLGVSDTGKHISVVNLVQGTAYVNWLGKSGDQISLNFSSEKLTLDHEAHFRVETSTEVAKLAVFKGNVDVAGPSATVAVAKKKTASFDVADSDKSTIADNVADAPLDAWDKEATSYHDQYSKNNTTPLGYGGSDLGYYGNYANVPGYGMLWQPFFTGASWNPFMDGAWSWYPGYGYMFVSAYPWGWTPYRYGTWITVPGHGWMWQPGGWNSWMAVPRFTGVTLSHPLVPPVGSVNTVAIGKGGPASRMPVSRMVINAGSAGLGIPRGSLGNLHHVDSQVAKKGFAEMRPTPQFSAVSGRGAGRPAGPSSGYGAPRSTSTTSAPSMGHTTSVPHASGGGVHH